MSPYPRPDGKQKTKNHLIRGKGVVIDHFTIINEVESELEGILTEGPS